jgi:uncharacterized protein (DUF2235 family)
MAQLPNLIPNFLVEQAMATTPLSLPAAKPHKKKIVICCDGTGNEFGGPNPPPKDPKDGKKSPKNKSAGQNSNVVKLFTALQIDNDQVGYYHPGVGTMGAPTATHLWSRWWSKVKGLAFGAGFRDNVLDAYRYLMEVYNDNGGNGNEDEVYIFGFSRGAYTARALAGFLHGYGLLCRGNEGHIPYAWRMYVAQHDDRGKHSTAPDEAFKETFSHKGFKINFVGVWDTVSSVGWIYTPLRLFNLAQNSSIDRIRHAVSIDEHRSFFQNNLFGPHTKDQDLVQAWFAGVHSDVGGSYLQPDSGLSDITLRWMLKEVGILPDEDKKYPDRAGILLNKERLDLVLGVAPSTDYPDLYYVPPTSSELHKSLTWKWWIPEIVPHVYYSEENGQEQRRVPLGVRRRQLPEGALVHASVADRMDPESEKYSDTYKPKNVCREELVRHEHDPVAADGTRYYRFKPSEKRKRRNKPLEFLDRWIVTWLFGIFDVLILVPGLVWASLLVVGGVAIIAARLLWFAAFTILPCLVVPVVHWIVFLSVHLMHYLRWLLHFGF